VRNYGQRFLFLRMTSSCLMDDVGAFPFLTCVIDFLSNFPWMDHDRAGATLSRGKRGDATDRMRDMWRLGRERQFYVRNPIIFINYSNHFYILFPSYTFTSGIIFYSLFFFHPFTRRRTLESVAGSHERGRATT
jgi:hypothetical protein